ncbi:MAG: hypothetical protein P8L77_00840 [Gammaproteobacteria bacterium]|nr:hypothetical protein [Gammaproteobacteria bacterium]
MSANTITIEEVAAQREACKQITGSLGGNVNGFVEGALKQNVDYLQSGAESPVSGPSKS